MKKMNFNVLAKGQMSALKGGESYAVYVDGELCCFVQGTKEQALEFAQYYYGPDAYVQKY